MNIRTSIKPALAGIVTLLSQPLKAAQELAGNAAPEIGTIAYLSKSVVALLVIVVLIFAVVWLMKRFGGFQGGGGGCISVVDTISLGSRERAVLLNVKGREILVGVAPGRVETLCDLGVSCDESTPLPTAPTPSSGFGAQLQNLIGRRGQP